MLFRFHKCLFIHLSFPLCLTNLFILAFMANGGMMGAPGMPQQPMPQQPPQPAKTGMMGGLFGGISKMTGMGAATTAAAQPGLAAAPTMTGRGLFSLFEQPGTLLPVRLLWVC